MIKDIICCCNQDITKTLRLDNPKIKNKQNSMEFEMKTGNIECDIKSKTNLANCEDIFYQTFKKNDFFEEFNANILVENGLKNEFSENKKSLNGIESSELNRKLNKKISLSTKYSNGKIDHENNNDSISPSKIDLINQNSIKQTLDLNKNYSNHNKKILILESSNSIFNMQKLKITSSGITNSLRNSNLKDGLVIFGFNDNNKLTAYKENINNINCDIILNVNSNDFENKTENHIAFFIYYSNSNDLFYIRNYEYKLNEFENDDNFNILSFNNRFKNSLLMKINKFHVRFL